MCPYPGTLLMILFALLPKSKQLSQSREWGGHKNHLEKGKDNYSLSNLKTQTIPVISCFSGSPERLSRYPSHQYISHILMTPPPSSTGSFSPSWEGIAPALCRHRPHYLMCFSKLWLWSNRLIQNGTQDKLTILLPHCQSYSKQNSSFRTTFRTISQWYKQNKSCTYGHTMFYI